MTKNKLKSYIFNSLFFVVYFIGCFTTSSDKLSGYFSSKSTPFIFFKFLLIFVCIFISTMLCLIATKSFEFISTTAPIITNVSALAFLFDYFVTKFSGSQFLFKGLWAGYIMCSAASLFISASIFHKYGNYKMFFDKFWKSYTPFFIIIFLLVFARTPYSSSVTLNAKPFNGTFKMFEAMLDGMRGGFEPPLIFFGNIVFFLPYGCLVPFYLKKSKPYCHIIIGFLTSILIEAYQYFFSCGDVDIDDVILNVSGFLIGFLIFSIINKNILSDKSLKNKTC